MVSKRSRRWSSSAGRSWMASEGTRVVSLIWVQRSSDCILMSPPSAQPNVPGKGIVASYGARFWMLVVLIGVGTGLAGAALMELLRAVQHLAWSYHSGPFLEAVQRTSAEHRVVVLVMGGWWRAPARLRSQAMGEERCRRRSGVVRACRCSRA